MIDVNGRRWVRILGMAVLAGLLVTGVLAGTALAQRTSPWTQGPSGPGGRTGGWGYDEYGSGHGMMGSGMMGAPALSAGVDNRGADGWGSSWGMMGPGTMGPDMAGGWGMMGPGMTGGWGTDPAPAKGFANMAPYGHGPGFCPMSGGWGSGNPGTGTLITREQAVQAANAYITAYGNPDLELVEVMEFTENFYAQAREQSTGRYAFEILINRYTGAVYPEPGPNMMWNTKYGHMGAQWYGAPSGEMPITPEQARTLAQGYLDAYAPGATVAQEADAFYGYYTLHTLRNGQITGMLSVNGYTGQVWVHTWHGSFIGMTGHEE